jgi:FtsH-binding integral membrane protein
MTDSSVGITHRVRGRLFLLVGLGVAVSGVVVYVAQFSLHNLMAPWYMPALATLGFVLVIISLFERRTVARAFAVVSVLLLVGAESAFLYAVRLPAYTGPITSGKPFPSFEAKRADGTPFTQHDLTGDQKSVLVFFRGRW